jgi:GNAT superfamily N-acetyltransferase
MYAARDEDGGLDGRLGVRPAGRSDGQAVMRLLAQLHPAFPPDPNITDEVIDGALSDPHRTLLVATVDDEVVATGDVIVVPNMTHGGHPWAAVENVVVDEAWRHRGIGRALFDEIDALTRAAGCYMVQLLSLDHRHEAHAFYGAIGYAPVAHGFRRYLDGFGPTPQGRHGWDHHHPRRRAPLTEP